MSCGTSGFATRMGEARLSLGLKRYADSDGKPLWRLLVSEYPLSPAVIEADADVKTLLAIRRFADEALKALETDGGREAVRA